MSNSQNDATAHDQNGADNHSLERFERNRFFNGKLMTARDMLAEQEYHADRLETLTAQVTGWGIVCGLGTRIEPSEDPDAPPRAVVEAGIAIDRAGRQIVVPERDSEPLPESTDGTVDEASVFVEYDTCLTESVPAHGSEDACKEQCDYNRTVETYEIVTNRGGPADAAERQTEQKQLPFDRVEFPTNEEVQSDVTTETGRIAPANDAAHLPARWYHELDDDDYQFRSVRSCETPEPGAVFLGHFEADEEGTWQSVDYWDDDTEPRPYVYTNDMLYTGLLDHATDFENPHELALSVWDTDGGASLGVEDREVHVAGAGGTSVDVDGSTLTISGGGTEGLDPLVYYLEESKLRRDALRKVACAFEELRSQFEYVRSGPQTGRPALLADAIATVTRDGLDDDDSGDFDEVYDVPERFTEFVAEQLTDAFEAFGASLPEFVGGREEFKEAGSTLETIADSVLDDEISHEDSNVVAVELCRLAEVASCLSGCCVEFGQFDDYTPVTSPLSLKDVVVDPKLIELPMLWDYVPVVVPIDHEVGKVLEFLDDGLRIELPPTDAVAVTVRSGEGFELSAFTERGNHVGTDGGDATDGSTATLEVSTEAGEEPITYLDLRFESGEDPIDAPGLVRDETMGRLNDEQRRRLEQSETETGQLVSVCHR
ncbi:hypothetical protein [Halosimplex amylolyticum]|uniref:hypothetical protein n=1 Tax=Halosimplex amylolyticum TaxID=3396616 RepID=UPI003F575214